MFNGQRIHSLLATQLEFLSEIGDFDTFVELIYAISTTTAYAEQEVSICKQV